MVRNEIFSKISKSVLKGILKKNSKIIVETLAIFSLILCFGKTLLAFADKAIHPNFKISSGEKY